MEERLGIYDFDWYRVEVFISDKSGGNFHMIPGKDKLASIHTGIDYGDWPYTLQIFMHEVFEFLLTIRGHRFEPAPHGHYGGDRFVFFFDHNQFSEIIACATEGLSNAIPDLKKAYDKWMAKRRHSKK